MMTVSPEFAARIDAIVGKLKSIALIASNLSAARRAEFIAKCRAEIVVGLREENHAGAMSEAEIQHGPDLATDALKKMMVAMSRDGAGNA